MSILDTLFNSLFGGDDDESESSVVNHPCSNCPSSCEIYPGACSVCKPYKEKMIDAIYRVEHKDEIISQYEVVGVSAQGGSVICPYCGGNSENHYICDYCGSRLKEGSGKIQVESASEIPNPVLEAQDLIFERYEAVRDFSDSDSGYGYAGALSGVGSEGLLSSIFSALTGSNQEADSDSIGYKMTEAEIEEMAKYYDVSVSEYLSGLDNGKYLTLSNKKAAAKAEESYSKTYSGTSSDSYYGGWGSTGGAFDLGSLIFGGSSYNRTAASRNYQNMKTYRKTYQHSAPKPQASQGPVKQSTQKAEPVNHKVIDRAPAPERKTAQRASAPVKQNTGSSQSPSRQTFDRAKRPEEKEFDRAPVPSRKSTSAGDAAAKRAPAPARKDSSSAAKSAAAQRAPAPVRKDTSSNAKSATGQRAPAPNRKK